jgi:NADPH:quinone reductase
MPRAAVFTGTGGVDSVQIRHVPRPAPGAGEVLVRVRASALNRADILQREGRYPPPPGAPSDVAGLEFAGEVVEQGEGAHMPLGERVFGLVDGGAHAEYVAVPEVLLVRVPPQLDWVQAAAVPEAFITAHDALITQGAGVTGEHVLIHAVGSGVGTAAAQLARALGFVPFGTTRTAEKLERARALGLEDGAALPTPDALRDATRAWTHDGGVDLVLDLLGGPYTEASIPLLRTKGRLVVIGAIAGREARVPLGLLLSRRLTLRGTVLRSRSTEDKAAATRLFERDVIPALERGAVRPIVDSRFPLDGIRDAYRRMESNGSFGKIVIEC